MAPPLSKSPEYQSLLANLKQRIHEAQVRAGLAVNRELVLLYWSIGREILTRQEERGWGAKVIDSLAKDLRRSFPEMQGLSPRNLKYMRAFAEAWPDEAIVQASLAQITWYHNLALLEKLKSPEDRLWYAQQTAQNGWSRNVLVLQIESGLYHRQGRALTNFARALPEPQSDLAQQILKDPYNFDFLTLSSEARERDLERALLDHIRQFLLELGVGFAFVGSQYPLEIAGQDFRLDLLFYHLRLRAYIVVEILCGRPHKRVFCGAQRYVVPNVLWGLTRTPGRVGSHITWGSKSSQEFKQVGIVSPFSWSFGGFDVALGEGPGLHLEIDFGVDVGCVQRDMSEPSSDCVDVHACPEKMRGGRVPPMSPTT